MNPHSRPSAEGLYHILRYRPVIEKAKAPCPSARRKRAYIEVPKIEKLNLCYS